MSDQLRSYPLPYLNFHLTRSALEYKAEVMARIEKATQLPGYRSRQAPKDLLAQMAFASCYDKMDQFNEKDLSRLRYDSYSDYKHGGREIKLVVAEASGLFGNTGPRMQFRLSKKTFEKTRADTFVLVSVDIPHVKFCGYLPRGELAKHTAGWFVVLSANTKELRPMWELKGLEESRVSGEYV